MESGRSDFGTGLEEVVAVLNSPSSIGDGVVEDEGGGGRSRGREEAEGNSGFFIGIFIVRILIFFFLLAPGEDCSIPRYSVDL